VFCKENLQVWPREYPGQEPELLDLPAHRHAVERPSRGGGRGHRDCRRRFSPG
jgi:hypothetical protein